MISTHDPNDPQYLEFVSEKNIKDWSMDTILGASRELDRIISYTDANQVVEGEEKSESK